jgi:DNA-binding NarL/FixJ family response regulator
VASSIRVLIADDHPVVLRGLADFLRETSDIVVVGQAGTGGDLVELCVELRPDVVIADIKMPGINGIEAVQEIRRNCPETHAIVMSLYHSEYQLHAAFRAGASAYITKESGMEDLPEIIRDVSSGKVHLPPNLRLCDIHKEMFTPKEMQVLMLWVAGLTTKEIMTQMTLARGTVDTYKARIMEKMGVHKETQVVAWAIKNGLA